MADTGSKELHAPTAASSPVRAKWELVADWAAVDLGMRPTEITLTVEVDANVRRIVTPTPPLLRGTAVVSCAIDSAQPVPVWTDGMYIEIEGATFRVTGVPVETAPADADHGPVFGVSIAGSGLGAVYELTAPSVKNATIDDYPSSLLDGQLTVESFAWVQEYVDDEGDAWEPSEEEVRGPIWPGITARALCGSIDDGEAGSPRWESINAGAFRISYGRRAVGRVVHVDLVSQRLYLGNCDFARVEALRWYTADGTPYDAARDPATFKIGAQVGVAQGGNYDEPACTCLALIGGGSVPEAAKRWLYPPPHATAFEPLITEYITDSPAITDEIEDSTFESDDPDFRYVQDQGQSCFVNPREGTARPASRLPVTSSRIAVLSTQPVPRPIWVGARFVLSL